MGGYTRAISGQGLGKHVPVKRVSLRVHLNHHLFSPPAIPKVDVRQNILHVNAKILTQI
jgi:hypothetical protein